jgi:hypothetical protein
MNGPGRNPAVEATFSARPAPRAHPGQVGAREFCERQDIEQHLFPNSFLGCLVEAPVRRKAGVVDEDVALRHAREYGCRRARLAQVKRQRLDAHAVALSQIRGDRIELVGRARDEDEVMLIGREQLRELQPEAARGPGNHGAAHAEKVTTMRKRAAPLIMRS